MIPKDIRSRYGFEPGQDIEMDDTGTALVLRPGQVSEPVIRLLKNGFPVIESPGQTQKETYDIVGEIKKTRDDRDRKVR